MRTLIFTLLLLAGNVFAQSPGPWINPFTTNRPPQPIFGDNNVAISNRIAGAGGGTNWNFYGIGAATVARLLDATNIARSIVAASNANYVLMNGGGGNDNKWTNSSEQFAITINHQNGDAIIFTGAGGITMDGDADVVVAGNGSAALEDAGAGGTVKVQDGKVTLFGPVGGTTNNGAMDVSGAATFGFTLKAALAGDYQFTVADDGTLNIGEGESILSPGHLSLSIGDPFIVLFNTDSSGSIPVWKVDSTGSVTNGGNLLVGGNQTNSGIFMLRSAASSKLAAWGTGTNLTNSVYSEADIAAIIAGLGNTNKYVLSQGGLGTNNTFHSATNTAQASNQVAMTVNGLGGQNTNLIQFKTNNVSTLTGVDYQGRIHINKAVPTVALDVTGAITASGAGTFGSLGLNGNISVPGGATISWSGQGNITSTASDDLNIYGNGFAALGTLYLGKRDSNTHALVLSSTPPKYFFRDGTKNSNCPVTVGTLSISNNYAPGTNSDPFQVFYPMSSTLAWQVMPSGNASILGTLTNKSYVHLPTNTAPVNTIVSGGLHVLTLGKGWTNDLGGRADLVMQVKFTDAATGDPSFAFTNTTSGVSWTNGIAFGIVGTDTRTIVEPDINPSDTGSLTDLSGTGASVTILQAWWKVK